MGRLANDSNYQFSYGGITLECCHILSYEREVILDGPTYLYTAHKIRIQGVYNPQLTAFTLPQGAPAPVPDAGGGNVFPATTDTAIRFALAQPRKVLTYTIGNVEMLRSPRNIPGVGQPFACDAANGPFPTVHGVRSVHGTKTWLVDWEVLTYIDERYLYRTGSSGNVPAPNMNPAILSHRWRMEEELDRDWFTARTIYGRVVFNTERLQQLNAVPDDFRAFLFHPLFQFARRDYVKVMPSEDGCTYDYILVDRMQPLFIQTADVTHIKAWAEVGAVSPNFEGGLGALGKGLMSLLPSLEQEQSTGLGIMFAQQGMGLMTSLVPLSEIFVTVQVWGKPRSNRKTLEKVAIGICLSRVAQMAGVIGSRTGTREAKLGHDVSGCMVECKMGLVTALTKNLLNLANYGLAGFPVALGLGLNIPDVAGYFPDDDSTAPFLSKNQWSAAVNSPPNDGGSRGDYVGSIMQQVLVDALTPVQAPTDPPRAGILTPP